MHCWHKASSKVLSYFIAFGEGGGGFVPVIHLFGTWWHLVSGLPEWMLGYSGNINYADFLLSTQLSLAVKSIYRHDTLSEHVLVPFIGLLLLSFCKQHAQILPCFLLHKMEEALQNSAGRWKRKVLMRQAGRLSSCNGSRGRGWARRQDWERPGEQRWCERAALGRRGKTAGHTWLIYHGIIKSFPEAKQNHEEKKYIDNLFLITNGKAHGFLYSLYPTPTWKIRNSLSIHIACLHSFDMSCISFL